MSISAPPGQPSITETLASSLRDGFALTKTNAVPVVLLLVLTAAGSIALVVTGSIRAILPAVIVPATATNAGGGIPPAAVALMAVIYVLFFVVSYCSLAAAIRTIHPEFRMTVMRFFGVLGYGLLASLLVMVAGLFFVIPAYWVGPKVLLMPYTYLLNGSGGVLKTTWDMTTGYYWQTVGMLLLAGLCIAVIIDAGAFVCLLVSAAVPAAAIVLYPLGIAIVVWSIHVASLVHVRWTNGLLPRAGMPQGAAAVPA